MKKFLPIFVLIFVFVTSCSRGVRKESPTPPPEKKEPPPEVIAENYVSDGIDDYQSENYEKAVSNWKEALTLIPQDAEVYNFLGLAYHKQGKLDSAIQAFDRAVGLDEKYYQAWNNLGFMHFLKSEYQAALPYFDRALQENPYYQQAVLNRKKTVEIMEGKLKIQAFELVEKTEKIDSLELKIKNYKRALEVDSNYVDAWNNLGVTYFYYGNTDSAVYCIKRALDINPDYPPAHNNAGYILDASGDYEQAVEHYQKAIKLRPSYLVAMANLVDTYVHKEDYWSARQILDALKKTYPENKLVLERIRDYQDLFNGESMKGGK